MKRRIERSRARCEKAAANNKPDKDRAADKQPKLSAAPPGADEKDD
ncbi:MAG TPA: hypothetical protein VF668_07200 [Pyrinomonadaceae bacterium]|jgi:hypothetical protein